MDDVAEVTPVVVQIDVVAIVTVDGVPYRDDSPLASSRFEIPGDVDDRAAYAADQVTKAVPHLSALLNQNPSATQAAVEAALS